MKMGDKEYLEAQLATSEMELKELETQHRIAIAVYDANRSNLSQKIYSIEKQLQTE